MTDNKAPSVTQADELRPCPFCGNGAPYVWAYQDKVGMGKQWFAHCKRCNISLSRNRRGEAIEAWNSREGQQTTAELRAENERLIKANRLRMEETHKERAEAGLWFDKAQEWRAENERLKLDIRAQECLQDSAYKAGLKAGRNLGEAGDEYGYQLAMRSTEHVAELKRIAEARAALSTQPADQGVGK